MDKAHIAFGAEVTFRGLGIDQLLFGRLDCAEYRGAALPGAINPDAKIDLVAARVIVVELDQREQRVGGLLF